MAGRYVRRPHPYLGGGDGAQGKSFGREEFLREVAAHLGRSEADGERAARSVFAAARKVLESPHLLRDLDRELPDDLREMWETPERV
jgi:uncharacterized protein (DUF2267 family)